MDRVRLENLRFDTIVGILEQERTTPQPIVLDVTLEHDLIECGRTGNLKLGVDYAALMDELMFLTKAGQFELLESLCLAACTWLLHPPHRPSPMHVSIAATKPAILAPHTSPSVQMRADAKRIAAPSNKSLADGVTSAALIETNFVRVEHLRLEPDKNWSPPRPCFAYQVGKPLCAEERKRPILRRVSQLVAKDATADWLLVTR